MFDYVEPQVLEYVKWVDTKVTPTIEAWTKGVLGMMENLSHHSLETLSDGALDEFARRLDLCQRALDKERQRRRVQRSVAIDNAANEKQNTFSENALNESMVEVEVKLVDERARDDDEEEEEAGVREFILVSPPPLGTSFLPTKATTTAVPAFPFISLDSLRSNAPPVQSASPPRPPRRSPPQPPSTLYPQVSNPSYLPTRGVSYSSPPRPERSEETEKILDELLSSPNITMRKRETKTPPVLEELKSPARPSVPQQPGPEVQESFFSTRRLSWTPRWPFSQADVAPLPSPISPLTPIPAESQIPVKPVAFQSENLDDDSPVGPVTRSKARRRARS